jgi:hypothetical protein
MRLRNVPRLIEVLRATLREVEHNAGVSPDDPALTHLKSTLLCRIAELEAERADNSESPVRLDTPPK